MTNMRKTTIFFNLVFFSYCHFFCHAMGNGKVVTQNGNPVKNGVLSPRRPSSPLAHSEANTAMISCEKILKKVKGVTMLFSGRDNQVTYYIPLKPENFVVVPSGKTKKSNNGKKKKSNQFDILLNEKHIEELTRFVKSKNHFKTEEEVQELIEKIKQEKKQEDQKTIDRLQSTIEFYKNNPTAALGDNRSFAERHVKLISFLSGGLGVSVVGALWLFSLKQGDQFLQILKSMYSGN